MGFFVGAVMREMGGQANPAVVNEVLRAKLGG
jgi:Asp-tRNA(Asn)/Glu-tRNA(Gln) amidotransferase B subunit